VQGHVEADEMCLITAKTVLDLAKRTKKIFFKFEIGEKTATFEFCLFELEN
jgi:hypothetical protein